MFWYVYQIVILKLEPRLTAQLLPPLVTGTSNKDSIELVCKAVVTEGVISESASYRFMWMKNGVPANLSNSTYMVCVYL